MPGWMKWILICLVVLLGLLALALVSVYLGSSGRMNKTYKVEVTPVSLPTDPAAIEQGRHIAVTRGCYDCHGKDLGGFAVIDAQPMGLIYGPNITPTGVAAGYDDEDWVRAIRHGLTPGGRPLILMPSEEYYYLSDADLGALIAFLKSLPPVYRESHPVSLGPIGRGLVLAGQLKLPAELIDHEAPRPDAPDPGVSIEYGKYLAVTCTGCHGPGFSGGPIPGGDPKWPPAANVSPDPDTGVGTWGETDFFRALREGKRTDGTDIDPVMPRAFGHMTDDELSALWLYLQSVPAKAYGNR